MVQRNIKPLLELTKRSLEDVVDWILPGKQPNDRVLKGPIKSQ